MDSIIPFLYEHAANAQYLIFGLLILAGFYVPVSEDVMIITGGILAGTVEEVRPLVIFFWIFAGCYLSDWIAYWLGRTVGLRLLDTRLLSRTVDRGKLDKIHGFYERYGFWTLLVGRFIPFGVRNCLFLTAGLGKMHFGKFLISDGIACILSNSALFLLAYSVGQNSEEILHFLQTFYLALIAIVLLVVGFYYWTRRRLSPES